MSTSTVRIEGCGVNSGIAPRAAEEPDEAAHLGQRLAPERLDHLEGLPLALLVRAEPPTAPACTVITDTECATTSCSSRAIRRRSSATARSAAATGSCSGWCARLHSRDASAGRRRPWATRYGRGVEVQRIDEGLWRDRAAPRLDGGRRLGSRRRVRLLGGGRRRRARRPARPVGRGRPAALPAGTRPRRRARRDSPSRSSSPASGTCGARPSSRSGTGPAWSSRRRPSRCRARRGRSPRRRPRRSSTGSSGARALVPGDTLLDGRRRDAVPGLVARPRRARRARPRSRPLLELPVERVLTSHGPPMLANGRDALARALAASRPARTPRAPRGRCGAEPVKQGVLDLARPRVDDAPLEQPGALELDEPLGERARRISPTACLSSLKRLAPSDEAQRIETVQRPSRRPPRGGPPRGRIALAAAHQTATCRCEADAGSSATSMTSSSDITGWNRSSSRTRPDVVVEVGAVPFGDHHVREPGGVRGEDLLLEPADRQDPALQRQLTGHPDGVLHRPAESSDAGRSPS